MISEKNIGEPITILYKKYAIRYRAMSLFHDGNVDIYLLHGNTFTVIHSIESRQKTGPVQIGQRLIIT